MKHLSTQSTVVPDWQFTSHNDWMKYIKTQTAK